MEPPGGSRNEAIKIFGLEEEEYKKKKKKLKKKKKKETKEAKECRPGALWSLQCCYKQESRKAGPIVGGRVRRGNGKRESIENVRRTFSSLKRKKW